jgi:Mg-chelatase subunit ChlD
MPEFAQPVWLLALLFIAIGGLWLGRQMLLRTEHRALAALTARALMLAMLVLALAGPLADQHSHQVDVVFAVDVSQSVGREQASDALSFVNQALLAKPDGTSVGIVVFGGDAGVERLVRDASAPIEALTVEVARGATDIARALEVAMGTFPSGGQRRIVILSDGRENAGRALTAAAVANAIGVQIHTIVLEGERSQGEVRADSVVVPSRVRANEPFQVEVLLHSQRTVSAQLIVMRNGALVHDAELTLTPGVNSYQLIEQVDQAGLYEYEAIINSEADGVGENNRYQSFVRVEGPPKVLHLVESSAWAKPVTEALRAQGLSVHEAPADALPLSLHELADYDLIVMNDVSGFSISTQKMQRLEEYVKDLGGGIIALGGERSFGGGGYYGTPIERLLPVSMDVKTQAQIPNLSVTIVLDRSGSMATDDKLYIAKSAALAAIDVLNPIDQVAVLAFDDEAQWSVPPTRAGDRQAIAARLRNIESGGGTDLYRALEEALRAYAQDDAKVRHLIILSDGLTDTDDDFETLVKRLVGQRVTVSAVAFGADSDQALLESVAAWGQGRYYYTDEPGNVPRIFTSEALVVSRDLHVETPTQPRLVFAGDMLDGLEAEQFPMLTGYQRTFAKPRAQVMLLGAQDDPLLVSWRYGLGKSAAFMSDLSGRWGKQWVQWQAFPQFMGQFSHWTMRRANQAVMRPTFKRNGIQAEIEVDVLDRDERFINGLSLSAVVVNPARTSTPVVLTQVAPGRYRGQFNAADAGRYYVSLSGEAPNLASGSGDSDSTPDLGPSTYGFAVPYSTEYVNRGADREHLSALAKAAGGRVLPMEPGSVTEIFASDPDLVSASERRWWPFVIAALCLLVLEVAIVKFRSSMLRARSAATDPGNDVVNTSSALETQMAAVREVHLNAIRDGKPTDSASERSARARLYVAGRGK